MCYTCCALIRPCTVVLLRAGALFVLRQGNNAGGLDQAEELFKKALAVQTRVFGPEHPSTSRTRGELERLVEQRRRDGDKVPSDCGCAARWRELFDGQIETDGH